MIQWYICTHTYLTVLLVAVCKSLLGLLYITGACVCGFRVCSGRPSLWRWSRRCRLQRRCWVRSFSSLASHGSCGLRSVPRPSGSARTCSSRSATPCTASWTWCASVSCVFSFTTGNRWLLQHTLFDQLVQKISFFIQMVFAFESSRGFLLISSQGLFPHYHKSFFVTNSIV